MASIGHLLVGAAVSRVPTAQPRPVRAPVLVAAALLPDADWLGYVAGVPYLDPFGRRGAAHSLVAALAGGLLAGWVGGRRWGVLVGVAIASHPVLDAMTDGGGGVAAFWPFTDARGFLPFRPIPVAPLGAGMLSERGVSVVLAELVRFGPLLVEEALGHLPAAWAAFRRTAPRPEPGGPLPPP